MRIIANVQIWTYAGSFATTSVQKELHPPKANNKSLNFHLVLINVNKIDLVKWCDVYRRGGFQAPFCSSGSRKFLIWQPWSWPHALRSWVLIHLWFRATCDHMFWSYLSTLTQSTTGKVVYWWHGTTMSHGSFSVGTLQCWHRDVASLEPAIWVPLLGPNQQYKGCK